MGILLDKRPLKNLSQILHNEEPPMLNGIDSIDFYLDYEDNTDNANKWLNLQSKEIQEK